MTMCVCFVSSCAMFVHVVVAMTMLLQERLTCENAELRTALAAAQSSKDVLEKEIISLKETPVQREQPQMPGTAALKQTHALAEENKLMKSENDRLKLELEFLNQQKVSI